MLTAREGEIGFVAVYDDGHVFEFAFSEAGELDGSLVRGRRWSSTMRPERRPPSSLGPANAQRRGIASTRRTTSGWCSSSSLIGVGRARRGEVLNAGQFVRSWAAQCLVRAIRGRFASRSTTLRDTIDPVRRFERDFPEWAAQIAAALEAPVEDAARALFGLTREILEPGWDEFPSRAADAIAARFGW